ncbi:hypothetical protein [Cardinium endosymbiont of Philonthus spinipes]|uniref:hypothetical protein n=1 Tax=Cardinium endosymbiont of Philonthus spinipes TaxID=3077941 RepID=UPI00313B8104
MTYTYLFVSIHHYGYVFLKKQVANPLPAAASPSIKKWRSSKTLTAERYVF